MKIRLDNIQQSVDSTYRKIKAFFYRYQGKNVLIFLFFVSLSFGFWVLLSLQEEYEIQITIPVRYKNIPADIAFVQAPPIEITARIRDKGTVLLNYTLGNKLSPLDIDMKEASKQSGKLIYSAREIESAILKRLIASTNLLSFDPPQIEEAYSKLINKKLPVVFDGEIRTEAGFRVFGEINIDPPIVDVYATDVVLDTMKIVKTVFTEIKKGSKTIKQDIKLFRPEGVGTEPTSVSVTIPIEEFTEKTFEIPVISKKVPSHYTIRMFPSVVKVTCSVPLSRFKGLSDDEFSVEITIESLDESISGILPVKLTKKPDWIDEVTISPESIEFILEQTNTND